MGKTEKQNSLQKNSLRFSDFFRLITSCSILKFKNGDHFNDCQSFNSQLLVQLADSQLNHGWFSLGIGDLFRLIPFGVAVGGGTYLTLMGLAKTPVVGPVLQDKLKKV